MYEINRNANRISPLQSRRFSELGFTERNHLQEWLANEPAAFGEELLIIQKEFDGFDDTRERLDLLALDKDGNLVVIENKLDDTGRDVMWQALKYASYCSSLSKNQIIDIYQSYLNRYCAGGNAEELICDFFDVPDIGEIVVNSGNAQRLIFVAANFRKEVTSTALWLLSHGIQLQCFKVTPFEMSVELAEKKHEQLFLNVEQIIPTPEAEEFMIGISSKEVEEKLTERKQKGRHKMRLAFWTKALPVLKDGPSSVFSNISPSKDYWLNAGSGLRDCPYGLELKIDCAIVEIGMRRFIAEENKTIYDDLFEHKERIEEVFGEELCWIRANDKKASKIQSVLFINGHDEENWDRIITWMNASLIKLEKAVGPYIKEANLKMKGKA